jgi:uncharacterized Tic20 family protein
VRRVDVSSASDPLAVRRFSRHPLDLNTVFVIIAAIQASDGKFYRYPMAIRLNQ